MLIKLARESDYRVDHARIKIQGESMYLKVKRLMDILLSCLGIIVLSPVFVILILAIKLDSKGPVLFK